MAEEGLHLPAGLVDGLTHAPVQGLSQLLHLTPGQHYLQRHDLTFCCQCRLPASRRLGCWHWDLQLDPVAGGQRNLGHTWAWGQLHMLLSALGTDVDNVDLPVMCQHWHARSI